MIQKKLHSERGRKKGRRVARNPPTKGITELSPAQMSPRVDLCCVQESSQLPAGITALQGGYAQPFSRWDH